MSDDSSNPYSSLLAGTRPVQATQPNRSPRAVASAPSRMAARARTALSTKPRPPTRRNPMPIGVRSAAGNQAAMRKAVRTRYRITQPVGWLSAA